MTRLRFRDSASMTLVLTLAIIQTAVAQAPSPYASAALISSKTDSADRSHKIYSLDDFASDLGLCEWIAQTIPEVIATGTWKGPGVIRYYAPKNILVVCHTSTVQAQVDSFLKDVKKSLSETAKARAAAPNGPAWGSEVVPASYHKPELRKVAKPTPEPTLSYPVPAQAKPPKHLFHFIIRYEGEGIIDDNVVKTMKDYYRAMKQASQTTAAPAPTAYSPQSLQESGSDDTPPATSNPPVKEKEKRERR